MDKKEIIKKIREIEINSSAFSNHVFSGEYHSFFKGNGMEFAGIRRYTEGDDVKKIDWKVSARQRKTYIKEYAEERELVVYILVDISNSNTLGNKREFLTELVGILSFSAIKNGDKVGLILFSNQIEEVVFAKKGRNHALSILEKVYVHKAQNKGTDIKKVLRDFNLHIKKRSIVIMISDFLDTDFSKEINRISKKHDFIPIQITEEKYKNLPKGYIFRFEDSEGGEKVFYENNEDLNIYQKEKIIHKNLLEINKDEDYLKKLKLHFGKRRR